MAKYSDFSPDRPLDPNALADMRQRLARLSLDGLRRAYEEAWDRCRLERNGRAPRAEFVQELVQVWKLLRKG
jgi:hypothetical protein